ncbi:MAG: RagB/SusD family nutrient uptake outer membrane protein, partial [Ginsengibacter sp.]
WKYNQLIEQNAYLFKPDIYQGATPADWKYPYVRIAYANVVLDGIKKIKQTKDNLIEWNQLKGSALFFRAYSFYDLVQLFAKPYDTETSNTDPGILIRLESDINVKYPRATVQECYERILSDLQVADSLLPVASVNALRPSKIAALALLARVNLAMGNYVSALSNANKALEIQHTLIDLNSLDTLAKVPFPSLKAGNKEVLFYSKIIGYGTFWYSTLRVDSLLYNSYSNDDLRRLIFFKQRGKNDIDFKGQYTGLRYDLFSGISINELFLIRAECYARQNNIIEAMAALNSLLVTRWKAGSFVPLIANGEDDALRKILEERRKEIPFNGNLRWEDLRRLNKDSRFEKTQIRILNGETFLLPPNDKRYVYALPDIEIQLSGLQQNPR